MGAPMYGFLPIISPGSARVDRRIASFFNHALKKNETFLGVIDSVALA